MLLLLALVFGLAGPIQAQPAAPSPAPPVSPDSEAGTDSSEAASSPTADWLVLPFLSFAPATGISTGGVLGYYRPDRRGRPGSSVQATITVTQKRQLIAEVAPELYLAGGRWRVEGALEASRFPDSFYGIGGDTPAAAEESFTARYALVEFTLQHRLWPNFRVGPRLFVRVGTITDADSSGLIAQDRVPGADGGLTTGAGLAALWDARDSRYYPRMGTYGAVEATLHSALLGSDYTFGRVDVDIRGYRSLGPGVLAGQGVVEAVAGTGPFQLLPLLGGPDQMRGYQLGRFRDNVYWTVQAEYRFPLFWRLKGTAFVTAGEVGPRVGADLVDEPEAAVGLGGRFQFTEDGVHGRLDVAYGRTGPELYISLGEAF
jgi:hypothetical protein